jgi:hypothetical protein
VLQLLRTAKDGIGRFLGRATLQTFRWCDWKCIFLQWTAGSIFLKREYPEKHNKINDLYTAIPYKGDGSLNPDLKGQADETSERSGLR